MCLNNESWSQFCIVTNIHNSADTITSVFKNGETTTTVDRFVKWNCDNHMGTILNVDESCNGIPIWTGFGGIFRNNEGFFLSTFSGMISHSDDILLAELIAIYNGLRMAIDMGIDDLTCYLDSLLFINLIKGDTPHYHIYVVLIQDIKNMLTFNNFSVHRTLEKVIRMLISWQKWTPLLMLALPFTRLF